MGSLQSTHSAAARSPAAARPRLLVRPQLAQKVRRSQGGDATTARTQAARRSRASRAAAIAALSRCRTTVPCPRGGAPPGRRSESRHRDHQPCRRRTIPFVAIGLVRPGAEADERDRAEGRGRRRACRRKQGASRCGRSRPFVYAAPIRIVPRSGLGDQPDTRRSRGCHRRRRRSETSADEVGASLASGVLAKFARHATPYGSFPRLTRVSVIRQVGVRVASSRKAREGGRC
jgi:hypothetical protein